MSDLEKVIWPRVPFALQDSLVMAMRRGSEAQGTYVKSTDPNSIDDRDIMGVCIPPLDYYLGLKRWEAVDEINGIWDCVLYEFRKFVGLLLKSNPNVIGMLWLDPEDYLKVTDPGRLLIENRNLFINKTALYKSFTNYAADQLRKMTANKEFKGYMGEKRKRIVEKFGYDVKDASHCLRLLTMAKEFLQTGRLQVKRTHDRELFVAVKTGAWKLEKVQQYAAQMSEETEEAYKKSQLPDEVDMDAVQKLVVKALRLHFSI